MSYVRVESSVARNRKFVKAGPAPAWLWLCGLTYCQEGLTDGFIPHEALEYLGVKNAKQLAERLVTAKLWDVVDGGWQVHDYLQHNKPAAEIRRINSAKKVGGNLGGRPKVNHEGSEDKTTKDNHRENLSSDRDTAAGSGLVAATEGSARETTDVLAMRLLDVYPKQGICSIHDATVALRGVLHGKSPGEFDALLARLETHKQSARWLEQGGKYIPRLDNYLTKGTHTQQMAAAGTVASSSKTSGNIEAARRFIERGEVA